MQDDKNELGLLTEQKGRQKVPVLCTENICKILNWHHKVLGAFRYDEFRQVFEMKKCNSEKWEQFDEIDAIFVQSNVASLFPYFQKVSKTMVWDAILKVGMDNRYDSALQYLHSLAWDETPRLDIWLTMVYGVENNSYHNSVASNWMKGLVNRLINPGSKFDCVMVLEGPQGSKKSMSLKTLCPDWYVETTMSTDNKDFFQQFQGKAIIEFSEGETLSKTEEKKMKAIITTEIDRYRPSYGRVTKDYPRRCVFAMTTNEEHYLKDNTGGRRWFPVKVIFSEINVDWLRENRDQLFAEAYHRVIALKEKYWEFPKEETLHQQSMRQVSEANEEMVFEWYSNLDEYRKRQGVTLSEVFSEGIHGNGNGLYGIKKPATKYEEMQMANILKIGMKMIQKQTMFNGIRRRRWYEEKYLLLANAVDKAIEDREKSSQSVLADKVEIESL